MEKLGSNSYTYQNTYLSVSLPTKPSVMSRLDNEVQVGNIFIGFVCNSYNKFNLKLK